MTKKLFVGNIEWGTSEDELNKLFSQYGNVEEVVIVKDRFSGRSRGFGFVTFTQAEEADKATAALNGYELRGRQIAVSEAKPPRNNRGRYR